MMEQEDTDELMQGQETAATSSNLELIKRPASASTLPTQKAGVPGFLNKLYTMVEDPLNDHLIRWSPTGDSFLVIAPEAFSKAILPRFFKHSNFGSFVRQLNMYGFNKVSGIQQGALQTDATDASETLEFKNENFVKDQPGLMCYIHRKKAVGKDGKEIPSQTSTSSIQITLSDKDKALIAGGSTNGSLDPKGNSSAIALDLRTMLSDIGSIRKHQTSISADLKELATSNKQLWAEAIASRERHQRHQDTINKIVRFLGTVFGGKVLEDPDLLPKQASSQAAPPPFHSTSTSSTKAKSVPKKRTLLLKAGPESTDGNSPSNSHSPRIQEIEVPFEELSDFPTSQPPVASTSSLPLANLTSPGEFPDNAQFLDNLENSFGTNGPDANTLQSTSKALYSPTTFANALSAYPFLNDLQMPMTLPQTNGESQLAEQNQQLTKATKDFAAITAQMDSLQASLDHLVQSIPPDQLPPEAANALNRITREGKAANPPTEIDSFDLDAFLQQFSNDNPAGMPPSPSFPGPSDNLWQTNGDWTKQYSGPTSMLPGMFGADQSPGNGQEPEEQRFWEHASSSGSNQVTPLLADLPSFDGPTAQIGLPDSLETTTVSSPKGKRRASDASPPTRTSPRKRPKVA